MTNQKKRPKLITKSKFRSLSHWPHNNQWLIAENTQLFTTVYSFPNYDTGPIISIYRHFEHRVFFKWYEAKVLLKINDLLNKEKPVFRTEPHIHNTTP